MAGKKCEFIKVMTPMFRASFPALDAPKKGPDETGEEKYGVRCLVPKTIEGKDLELMNALQAACKKAATDFFGEGNIPKSLKKPIRDGDAEENVHEKGYWAFTARSAYKPGVVDAKCRELTDEEIRDQVYPGCWARATILVGVSERAGNKCVYLVLSNLQKVRDDKPFGNRKKATDDFSPVSYTEAGEDFKGEDDDDSGEY